MKNVLRFLFFSICLIGYTLPVSAIEKVQSEARIPFSDSYYYHFSRDQQLNALIKDFCSMQSISVVVSPTVTDIVNGRFNKMSPVDFWNYITQAYGLSWFYDGKILYVYKSSELQTQIFKMDAAGIATLSNIIDNLGFNSSDFSFRAVPNANILIVTAPPKYLETINDLSIKFVAEKISDTTIVKSFPIKYAWAYDMSFTYKDGSISVPGIASLLQNIVSGRQTSVTMSGMDVNLNGQTQSKRSKMQGLISQNNPPGNNNNQPQDSQNKNEKSNDDFQNQVKDTSTLPGFITCDQRLNAVIIRDKHENMQFYEDIIKQLDVPCEVIKIDVAIVDVDRSNEMELGIDGIGISADNKRSMNVGVTGKSQGVDSKGGTTEALIGTGNISGALKGILKGYTISSFIQALESHGNAKTVARPSVLTLDNVGAVIEKEQTMYSKVKGAYTEGLYNISAVTKMQVVPHIIPDEQDEHGKKKLKMFVNVQDGSLSGESNDDATPQCDSNSINTQAVLYEGQSLLIGGYFKENAKDLASGVPIIQNIPLIGQAFKRTITQKQIVERIYVISPNIVDINSQDHKYGRFMGPGELEANTIDLDFDKKPKKHSSKKIFSKKILSKSQKKRHGFIH